MLTPAENARLTRIGPGTPMGAVFRRYWLPALLAEELPEPDGPPLRVRMLGEDLVAFRDTSGAVGLVDAFCPHRRAPMFFGRNEERGLRCVYHGWKFDAEGRCVDMPSEPPDSAFRDKVRISAYPTWEGGGIVWAYLGPPERRPAPPDYELVRAPATHRYASKNFQECNWLQALEGGLDNSHPSFLHNMDITDRTQLRSQDTAPRLEVERTDYGQAYAAIRTLDDREYVRAYHYVMPSQAIRGRISGRRGGMEKVPTINGHIWVPIDDVTCWVYNWMVAYDPAIPITPEYAREHETQYGRGPDDLLPGYRLKRNLRNDYLIDRHLQKTKTFSGIAGINTQDVALQEGMGPVCDRSREHLGTSDRVIIGMRQLLAEALTCAERGEPLRGADAATYRDVRAADFVLPRGTGWRDALRSAMLARF